MIIEQKHSEVEILQTGNNDTIGMSLDMGSANILMNMLSKNLYSDAIGSTIRETVSNSLDSHRRSKCNKVIIVSLLLNEEGNYEFSSEDFGIGLDDNDVKNIISKYGMSTKRQESNTLGAMGLGFKAPLAYSSTFYFTCRKGKIERKYMMYESEEGNSIDLLYESPTTECNGVKVIIPVNYNDRMEFYHKIQEQLAYFQNVYFNVNVNGNIIDNEFKIHRSTNYQFSELATDSSIHICLDDVYYPLDFNKLGITRIQIPLGLRFDLNSGLMPIPSREALLYNNRTKELILNKISLIANEFIIKYNNSIKDTSDIQEIFKYYNQSGKYLNINEKSIDITTLKSLSKIEIAFPKLTNVSLLNLKNLYSNKEYILGEYTLKYKMDNYKFKENKFYYNRDIKPMYLNKTHFYIYTDTIPFIKKTYLRNTLNSSTYFFVKKTKSFKLFPVSKRGEDSYQNYFEIIGLHNYPKNQWRQLIKEFQYVQELLLKNFINVNELVIPQEWYDARKKVRISTAGSSTRKVKLQGEIICKEAVPLLRCVSGKNCKFDSCTYKIEELYKQKCLFVYTEHSKALKLDKLFESSNKQKIKFITFSDVTLKVIQKLNIHNLISYEKFMEGKNAPFKRIVTSYVIKELIDKNNSLFTNLNVIKLISENLYKKLDNLYQYQKTNHAYSSDTAITAMLEVALNNNLFDNNIYPEYLEIKTLLEKLPFVNIIAGKISYYNIEKHEMFPILIDMFKYYKQRIDYKHYNITLNEEKTDVLTKELIEELV